MQAGLDLVVQANSFPWGWLASWSMDVTMRAGGPLGSSPGSHAYTGRCGALRYLHLAIEEEQVEEANVSRTAGDSGESLGPCRLPLVIVGINFPHHEAILRYPNSHRPFKNLVKMLKLP